MRDLDLGSDVPARNKSTTTEPCAAKSGRTVVVTGNWFAAVSNDGGASFRFLDPFSFFPGVGDGFCCDQSVVYDPSRDLFAWTLLYRRDAGGNTLRVAIARGADAVAADAWVYQDLTAADLGLGKRSVLDFPQLAVSGNALFVTVNVLTPKLLRLARTAIVRLALDDLASRIPAPFEVYAAGNRRAFAATQGAASTMYFVGAKPGAADLPLYRWPDGGRPRRLARLRVRRGARRQARCPGPDGHDWCGDSDDRVLGAWVARGVLGFMWNAPADRTHPFPYVRSVRVDEGSGSVLDQPEVSSTQYAIQYPAVGVNVRGDVAGVVAFGGGSRAPGIAALAWNDGSATPGWDFREVVAGSNGPETNRWGDFFCARPDYPAGEGWVLAAQVLDGGPTGEFVRPHLVEISRQADAASSTSAARASSLLARD